jgi:hypothetical protein
LGVFSKVAFVAGRVGPLAIDDEIDPAVFSFDGYARVVFLTHNWYLETP